MSAESCARRRRSLDVRPCQATTLSTAMKPAFSIVGLTLLVVPLVRHLSFDERLHSATSRADVVSSIMSISSGLMCGFVGIMLLGFICDAGRGYRRRWLFVSMATLGGFWCYLYPSGWLLGLPLVLYPMCRLFAFGQPTSQTPVTEKRDPKSSPTPQHPA